MVTFPHSLMPAEEKITRRGLALNAGEVELLRRVRDTLAVHIGRASYVTAILYGLRLAAMHLGIDPNVPLQLADADTRTQVPQADADASKR